MPLVVNQYAGVGMKRLGAFRQHAGAFGWQGAKGLWLWWRFAFSGCKTPVETAKDHTYGPGQERIGRWHIDFGTVILIIVGIGDLAALYRSIHSLTVRIEKTVEVKSNGI